VPGTLLEGAESSNRVCSSWIGVSPSSTGNMTKVVSETFNTGMYYDRKRAALQ
jgi:hypothetical protein